MTDTYQSELDSNPGMKEAMDQSSAPPEPPADDKPVNPVSGVLDDSGEPPDPGAGTSDAMLTKIFGQMAENEKQAQARLDKLQAEEMDLRHGAIDAAKERSAQIERDRLARPKPPQLQSVPKPPQQDLAEGWQGFMLAATAIGALAGTRARNGTTLSLNAFNAAIQGFHNGQMEVFKQKSDEWKQLADQTISDNQEKLQQYSAIWKDEQMNLDQKMEEYKVVASTYHDQLSYNLADQRNVTLLGQNYQKDVQNTLKAADTTAELDLKRQRLIKMKQDEQDEANRIENMAQAIKDNRLAPSEVSFKDRNKVANRALQLGVNVREKDQKWDIIKAEVHTLNGATIQRQVSLDASFSQEFARVQRAHAQLKNLTGAPDWNQAKIDFWERTQGNKPIGAAAAEYMTGVKNLQELMASAYRQGYAPTESSFALAKEAVKPGWTANQMEKAFGIAKDMLDIRVQNIKNLHTLGPEGAQDMIGGGTGGWSNYRVSP